MRQTTDRRAAPGQCAASNALEPHAPSAAGQLTRDQQCLAARNLGLVGVHLRQRVGRGDRAAESRREELFQVGSLALVQAAERYDAEHDGPFAAYALPRIRRAVHEALLGEGSLIRVPYGAASRRSGRRRAPCQFFHLWLGERGAAPAQAFIAGNGPAREDTIRHVIRGRFERAAGAALKALAGLRWRRPDTPDILARVLAERVLISDPAHRTSIRELARAFNIPCCQITCYEQRLMRATEEQLRKDARVPLLLAFAREDPGGFDAVLDDERRRRLVSADLGAFDQCFASLDAARRAQLLYTLVERSTGQVREVARNLFLLTMDDRFGPHS